MKVLAGITTYNGLESGPYLNFCVDYLFAGAPEFGDLFDELAFYPHVISLEPVLPTLERMAQGFSLRLATLPIVQVNRRFKKGFVSYHSVSIRYTDLLVPGPVLPDHSTFNSLCGEMVFAASLLKTKVRQADKFSIRDFEGFLEGRLAARPESLHQFSGIKAAFLQKIGITTCS